jgi:hypothetical protein
MGEQTRNILGIAGYLKEAGTDASRVVSASIFVTDMSKKKEMDAAWTEFFGDTADARNGRCRRSRWRRLDRSRGHRAQGMSGTRSQAIARRIAAASSPIGHRLRESRRSISVPYRFERQGFIQPDTCSPILGAWPCSGKAGISLFFPSA